jgi:predicted nucleic acid-binding protein
MTSREVFLDTSFAIALSASSDVHHDAALRLATQVESDRSGIVTTRAILLESGNSLARARFRSAATELLQSIEEDPAIEIVSLTEELYEAGVQLFLERADKEWGLTDCTSFVVMRERGISDALTGDDHFRQAGFVPLLRQSQS